MATPAASVHSSHDPITLTRFLLAERQQFQGASGSFALLLQSVQLACKVIANATTKAGQTKLMLQPNLIQVSGIANLYGIAGSDQSNTSGDVQKKLDVFANDAMINCLKFSKQAYILCSEEEDKPIIVDDDSKESSSGYAVVFDPLDGSSNIDCQGSVGTIFGIYKKDGFSNPNRRPDAKDLLRVRNHCFFSQRFSFCVLKNILLDAVFTAWT